MNSNVHYTKKWEKWDIFKKMRTKWERWVALMSVCIIIYNIIYKIKYKII